MLCAAELAAGGGQNYGANTACRHPVRHEVANARPSETARRELEHLHPLGKDQNLAQPGEPPGASDHKARPSEQQAAPVAQQRADPATIFELEVCVPPTCVTIGRCAR